MQDWRELADKNQVSIRSDGPCQLCGAPTTMGIAECVEIGAQVTHKMAHDSGVKTMCIFLCVDAHALTHAQIHGRWNNHYHLTRLYLILVVGVQWKYAYSSVLSCIVDKYKVDHMTEYIFTPDFSASPGITVCDFHAIHDESGYVELVWQWAREVYSAFSNGHEIAAELGEKFLGAVCLEVVRNF